MAGLEMGLNYRICGPPPYAVRLLAAARAILDAVVCLLIPIPRMWASSRTEFCWHSKGTPKRHGRSSAARLFPSANQGTVLVCVTERQESRLSPVWPSVEREGVISRPVRLLTASCCHSRLLRLASPSDPNGGQQLSRGRDRARNRCGILFRLDSVVPSGPLGLQ